MKLIENNIIEFKLILNDKFEKEIVGFLNSKEGGNLYIGVDDDGIPHEIKDHNSIVLEIKDRIKNNISPSTLGLFDVIDEVINGIQIIRIIIASGSEKPYYIRKKGMSEEGCYIRVGNATEKMTLDMITDMFSKRIKNSLKTLISPTQNLTFSQLKIYYEENGFDIGSNFLHQLELINDNGQYNYVAYLLSDNNSISMKVAKYRGTDTYDLENNSEYGNCCLIKAAKNVLDRFQIENKTFTKITGKERKEIKLFDSIALREIIINAIVHNDYTYEYPPKFEIFDDHIEISSAGGLPERFTTEDFLAGFSAPKNKELMRVFKDVGLVEQLGTGIRRVLKVYDKSIYQFYPNFIRVSIPFRMNEFIVNSNDITNASFEANGLQNKIIELIKKNSKITQEKMAEELDVSRRTIIRNITILVQNNILEKVGSKKTGYWELKFK
jgi:predicted HTH transcriptional regulator